MRLQTKQTTSFCLSAVRKGLKVQGLSYAQVAEVMGVSEATIKRMLHDDSIRFDRLLTLCNLAKLSIAELMAQAEEKPLLLEFLLKRVMGKLQSMAEAWKIFLAEKPRE